LGGNNDVVDMKLVVDEEEKGERKGEEEDEMEFLVLKNLTYYYCVYNRVAGVLETMKGWISHNSSFYNNT